MALSSRLISPPFPISHFFCRRSEEIETISNGRLPNGGRGFKVGFDAIEPQSSSPPMRRPQSKK